jgi:hypothetical protein
MAFPGPTGLPSEPRRKLLASSTGRAVEHHAAGRLPGPALGNDPEPGKASGLIESRRGRIVAAYTSAMTSHRSSR